MFSSSLDQIGSLTQGIRRGNIDGSLPPRRATFRGSSSGREKELPAMGRDTDKGPSQREVAVVENDEHRRQGVEENLSVAPASGGVAGV